MKLTKAQTEFLNRYVKGSWNLNSEGFLDVKGSFNCSERDIKDFRARIYNLTVNIQRFIKVVII